MVQFANSGDQQIITVTEGQAVVIDLPPLDCYPAPTVFWRNVLTGFQISVGIQHYHISLSNQLVVLSSQVTRDNATKFRAEAINTFTSESSNSATFLLSVNGENEFVLDVLLVIPKGAASFPDRGSCEYYQIRVACVYCV